MSTIPGLVSHLQRFGLKNEEATLFASLFKEKRLIKKGDYFLEMGTICNEIAFLEYGMLRYFYITQEGNEITRWMSLSEQLVSSLSSFITQKKATENIQAIRECVVWLLNRDDWQQAYKEHAFLRDFWLRILEYHYVGMETRVQNLISMSAAERYDWVRDHQPRFILEVPDKYLASMIGVQPRHLTRLRNAPKK